MCAEVEPSSPKSSDSQGSRRGVMFRNRESVRGPSVFWLDFLSKSMLFVGKMFFFCPWKSTFDLFILVLVQVPKPSRGERIMSQLSLR